MKNISISTKFFDDERIIAISGEFGIAGELCAIKLLCEIYSNGYYLEWTTLKQNSLARMFGVSPELLRQIVKRLAEYGFFSEKMLNKHRVLTTEDAQRRYFRPKSRRRDISNIPYLIITLVSFVPDDTTSTLSNDSMVENSAVVSIVPPSDSKQNDAGVTTTDCDKALPPQESKEKPLRTDRRPNKIGGVKIKYVARKRR